MNTPFKGKALLIFVLFIAFILRFYKINENVVFHGELGSNYLAIKDFLISGKVPLRGPATSHPWLYFGPIYYWLISPFFALFDFDPKIGAYFFGFLGVFLVFINYYFTNKIFNKQIAIVSSFVVAVSPLYLNYAREARFFSIVLLVFYPFYYYLLKVVKDKTSFFALGFWYGLFFSFHYSPLILLPVIFAVFWSIRKKLKSGNIVKSLLGFLLPNTTLIIADLLSGGAMFRNLVLWIPYRLLGFLGLYPKNNLNNDIFLKNINSILDFLNSILFPPSPPYKYVGFFLLLLIVLLIFKKPKKLDESIKVLLSFVGWGVVLIFIHGDPPSHYFLPIITPTVLLFSIGMYKLWKKNKQALLVGAILFLMVIGKFYFSERWFYKYKTITPGFVNYKTQMEISKKIVHDAQKKPFSLYRKGEGDEFEDNYSQNYMYLMWYLGNQPVKNAKVSYTIYEDEDNIINPFFEMENVVIVKNE